MPTILTAKARDKFADLLGQVDYAKERVTLTRRGRAVAALAPMDDLELLEALEDRMDAEDALSALKEPGESTPWEDVKKDLGL